MGLEAEKRISVAELRARQSKSRTSVDSDGRRRVQQLTDKLTPLEAAGAGKDKKFTTYISKARFLQVVMKADVEHVVGSRVTRVPGKIIHFQEQIYTAQDQEEEDFLRSSTELGKRYFTKAQFVAMTTDAETRLAEELARHKELLKREMSGETEFPQDKSVLEGLVPGADPLAETHRGKEVNLDDGDPT